jgi:hypothetical protein
MPRSVERVRALFDASEEGAGDALPGREGVGPGAFASTRRG